VSYFAFIIPIHNKKTKEGINKRITRKGGIKRKINVWPIPIINQ